MPIKKQRSSLELENNLKRVKTLERAEETEPEHAMAGDNRLGITEVAEEEISFLRSSSDCGSISWNKASSHYNQIGSKIQEKGGVVRGCPMVQPGDDLFWFDNPVVMLFFIHLVLFTNAFQLAFFAWSSYEFGFCNCFHKEPQDIAIRIVVGLVVQILCSYVTLPLYALVIQMGSRMKPTIFNQRVSKMLKKWHHTAHEETHHGRHNSNNRSGENIPNPPPSNSDHHQFYDPESQQQAAESSTHHPTSHESASIELPTIRPTNA